MIRKQSQYTGRISSKDFRNRHILVLVAREQTRLSAP
jgi:hypothetical protein